MSDTSLEVLPPKEWRLRWYWTYRHLTKEAGVSTFTLQKAERGNRVQEITARKIADALGVSVGEIAEFARG